MHADSVLVVLSCSWSMCLHNVLGVTTAHARSSFPARPGPKGRRAGVRVRGWGDARTVGSDGGGGAIEGGRHGWSDTLYWS